MGQAPNRERRGRVCHCFCYQASVSGAWALFLYVVCTCCAETAMVEHQIPVPYPTPWFLDTGSKMMGQDISPTVRDRNKSCRRLCLHDSSSLDEV
ncbi:uncharacterized protein J3D65DRAFT_630049, partial [Phyllosticta citribraziliensis]